MNGVTTSSLSLAWSLWNWVILEYVEPYYPTVRPCAPLFLHIHFLYFIWSLALGVLPSAPRNTRRQWSIHRYGRDPRGWDQLVPQWERAWHITTSILRAALSLGCAKIHKENNHGNSIDYSFILAWAFITLQIWNVNGSPADNKKEYKSKQVQRKRDPAKCHKKTMIHPSIPWAHPAGRTLSCLPWLSWYY